MANKRTLKKNIDLICASLFADTVAVSLYGTEAQQEQAETLLNTIAKMEVDFLGRVCHPEPGMKPNDYFKDLREKFSSQVQEILDQINA